MREKVCDLLKGRASLVHPILFGESKDVESLLNEARAIRDGGGQGSIMGRNTFQRPKAEALALLRASGGIAAAKATVHEYAAQARGELAGLPDVPGRQALASLVEYTVNRHG